MTAKIEVANFLRGHQIKFTDDPANENLLFCLFAVTCALPKAEGLRIHAAAACLGTFSCLIS
jgi:hypothetical protein